MLKIRAEGDPAGGGVPDGLKIQGLTDAGSLKGFILDQMIPEKRGGGNGAGPEP
ncbi:MAG: hypothetical protein GKC05_03430 [Methanomicrobiales archaeon]|nr:hypothetical protein [Methanomicrobiales archaeon]